MTEQDALTEMLGPGKWVGFDFDGTIATYDGFRGAHHLGEPIASMVDRVKRFRSENREVRIVTARATLPDQIVPVQKWSKKHLGEKLPVTNIKDFAMGVLYDDRAIQVISNTGKTLEEVLEKQIVKKLLAAGWTPPQSHQ